MAFSKRKKCVYSSLETKGETHTQWEKSRGLSSSNCHSNRENYTDLFYATIPKDVYSPGDSFPNLLNIFILSGNMLLSKLTRQDERISVGGTAVHLECNLCFFGQSSCREKCVCPAKKNPGVSAEKIGIAHLAGERSMLHCMEGL